MIGIFQVGSLGCILFFFFLGKPGDCLSHDLNTRPLGIANPGGWRACHPAPREEVQLYSCVSWVSKLFEFLKYIFFYCIAPLNYKYSSKPSAKEHRQEFFWMSVVHTFYVTHLNFMACFSGVVPNVRGRVLSDNSGDPTLIENGLYVCGWLKRGPTGIIATNLYCAEETVSLASPWQKIVCFNLRDKEYLH